MDCSSQVKIGQRVQARKQGEQLGATVGIKRRDDSAQTGTVAVQIEKKGPI